MATNDVYLRPDAGDGTNGVRLRPDAADAGGTVNYTLVCAVGAYAYSGVAANLTVARRLALSAGAYTYTGQTAGLTLARRLSLSAGAYTYTGVAASLGVARKLALAAGAYTYSGVAAALRVDRNLALSAGSYAYAGQDATLAYVPGAGAINYVISLAAGSYAYSGSDATLTYVAGTPAETVVAGGGGYPSNGYPSKHPWIHGLKWKDKIGEVEPEIVEAVVDAVATAVQDRTIQNAEIDTAKAEKELRAWLEAMQRQWASEYAQLIALEYERREQEYEDAQIAMLLFDM